MARMYVTMNGLSSVKFYRTRFVEAEVKASEKYFSEFSVSHRKKRRHSPWSQ